MKALHYKASESYVFERNVMPFRLQTNRSIFIIIPFIVLVVIQVHIIQQ